MGFRAMNIPINYYNLRLNMVTVQIFIRRYTVLEGVKKLTLLTGYVVEYNITYKTYKEAFIFINYFLSGSES